MDKDKYGENEDDSPKIRQEILDELDITLIEMIREGGRKSVDTCKKRLREVIENAVETES